jgi:sulfotransferase family protein
MNDLLGGAVELSVLNRLKEPGEAGMARSKAPVFVVGCPRSGTTFLFDALCSSGVFPVFDQESHVFGGLVTRVGSLSHRKNREELFERWTQSSYFKPVGIDLEEVRRRIVEECNNGGDFLRIVMESMARQQNKDRWAEHTPDHVLYLKEIKRTLPDALILHLIRDGRDVALSLDRQGFLNPYLLSKKHSLVACGVYWEWLVEAGLDAGTALGTNYMEVRFEDLITKPHETFAKIGLFIDEDLDYDRIRQQGVGAVNKPNTSFKAESTKTGFDPVSRWKRDYPKGELLRLEKAIGPFLKKMGYQLSTPENELGDTFGPRSLRTFYRNYLASRLFVKTYFPMARYFVRDR